MNNRRSSLAMLAVLPLALAGPLQAATSLAAVPAMDLGNIDGDGGVSAFYSWDGPVGAPGRMLRQEPLPADLTQPQAAKRCACSIRPPAA